MPSTILTLFLLVLPLAQCWWDVGHMLTASIAQLHLNKKNPDISISFRDLTKSINSLVDNKSQTFIESSCWPDDLKGKQYNMALWNAWHYTDRQLGILCRTYVTDGVFPVINFTEVAVNSVEMVYHAVRVLKTNLGKKTAERALFARYLVHVVGDMHQPLHSVALFNATYPTGDRGGNSLKVKLPDGTTQNFHSYWDAGGFRIQNDSWTLPRPLSLQNLTKLRQISQSYMSEFEPQLQQLSKQLDPTKWAIQSYKIAMNTTYPYLEKSNELSEQYINLTYQTSRKRIALAGYRLANLVLSIYGGEDVEKRMGMVERVERGRERGERMGEIWETVEENYGNRNKKEVQVI